MTHRHYAHTLHAGQCHYGWDNALAPVQIVPPGETLLFHCKDASDGQITATSTSDCLARLDAARTNPVNGPVFIEGAMPGDALKVTIGAFTPSGFGWTGIIPGFGLLADQFPVPKLHLWHYDTKLNEPAAFSPYGRVPLMPFAGTIGVAPAEAGRHDIIPPRHVGGNMDMRELRTGSILYLPVEVEGALFSIGDTHAAQGDGEVCGTAIESAMDVEITLDVVKGGAPRFPRLTTLSADPRHLDRNGAEVTTGIGPDLMAAARDAVSGMIDLLCGSYGMAPEDAYMLVSVCADLRLSEVVDAPNWVVSFHMPRSIFD
ncbi:acetamidase/formamidase family protein [Pseudohoeflea coraliihabitans]|uniref:Acetamidase/formamidase family protein n=1 Tax=Pseudohoeflea coraliihabitans TaxID=2860393 RepID=A0ABS6WPQ1_9HYPH|nr:acetamidase/formamidase family protein [Pseudohoeflea sp. DP4N28-3]MBW3097933.1 acetamidase/formamidase family protein [Pseudohoeflea sp. DP4N28-3]